jgi:hypothetical protein
MDARGESNMCSPLRGELDTTRVAEGVVASTTCEAVVSTGHRIDASPTHQLVITAASKE